MRIDPSPWFAPALFPPLCNQPGQRQGTAAPPRRALTRAPWLRAQGAARLVKEAGAEKDKDALAPVRMFKELPPIQEVACGMGFSVVLLSDGRVFSGGLNHIGQLGHGNADLSERLRAGDTSSEHHERRAPPARAPPARAPPRRAALRPDALTPASAPPRRRRVALPTPGSKVLRRLTAP